MVFPGDPEWLDIYTTGQRLGLTPGGVRQNLTDGRLEGAHVYFADGDREPPGLRWAVRTKSEEADEAIRAGLSKEGVGRALGYDYQAVDRLAASGLLQAEEAGGRKFYPRPPVADVLAQVLTFLSLTVTFAPGLTPAMVRRHFIARLKTLPADRPLRALIYSPSKLTQRMVDHWLGQLVDAGAVAIRADGTIRPKSAAGIGAFAKSYVDSRPAYKVGMAADPEVAARQERKSLRPLGYLADGSHPEEGRPDTTFGHITPDQARMRRTESGYGRTKRTKTSRFGERYPATTRSPRRSDTARRSRRRGGPRCFQAWHVSIACGYGARP